MFYLDGASYTELMPGSAHLAMISISSSLRRMRESRKTLANSSRSLEALDSLRPLLVALAVDESRSFRNRQTDLTLEIVGPCAAP